jgi:Protein of unknown function (DUF3293)
MGGLYQRPHLDLHQPQLVAPDPTTDRRGCTGRGRHRAWLKSPCHVVTAYNPGGSAAAEVDNQAAARALWAEPRLDGLVLLPSFGGHPDGAWLEPGVAVLGLSRHQAQVLGQAYGQLAVYELDGAIRRVVACDRDQVQAQAVVCQRERQPPTPKPSPRS